MPDLLTTGIDLYAWRARLGLSVVGGAADLRIQPTSLRNIEAGRKAASATLLRLAELLELQHAAPIPAPASVQRPVRMRKPKPEYADAFKAAIAKARVTGLSAEAVCLLRTEVDRQRAGGSRYPADAVASGEDMEARRTREAAWRTAVGCDGPLYLVASAVAHVLSR